MPMPQLTHTDVEICVLWHAHPPLLFATAALGEFIHGTPAPLPCALVMGLLHHYPVPGRAGGGVGFTKIRWGCRVYKEQSMVSVLNCPPGHGPSNLPPRPPFPPRARPPASSSLSSPPPCPSSTSSSCTARTAGSSSSHSSHGASPYTPQQW